MQTAHAIKGKTVFNNSTLSPNPEKPEITNYNIQISIYGTMLFPRLCSGEVAPAGQQWRSL
jgi:hypothetical protein